MSAGTKARKFRLSDELWEACTAKAERTGIPVSEHVRKCLEEWVKETES